MKFGRHLTQAIGVSNPEWMPFFTNYQLLKEIIKDLPFVVPTDSLTIDDSNTIRKNPNEVRFFKQVHSEFEKVSSFFGKAKKELKIRYDRVVAGFEIFSNPYTENLPHRWNRVGRSAYQLHKSLLLLEAFAIMNYCAFSKILKKHDKRTGYSTKVAFMTNVVNKSNFAAYPDVLDMIRGCQELMDKATNNLEPGEKSKLQEEHKLLTSMMLKIKKTQGEEKKDDAATYYEQSSSLGDKPTFVTPTNEKPTLSIHPSGLKRVYSDLTNVTRPRTVSEHLLILESPITHIEKSENCGCTNESFHCSGEKHHIGQVTFQCSKKQRRV